jgi:LDH2 family malate/lactate/ureidoglycolate dehydrogenase
MTAAYGDILMALKEGSSLAPGLALGRDGKETGDPSAAKEGAFLPFGGAKGAGLGLAVQILAGVLTGGEPLKTGGFLFFALSPQLFDAPGEFIRKTEEYLGFVQKSGGSQPVRYPGEGSNARREKNSEEGVEVSVELLEQVRRLAEE